MSDGYDVVIVGAGHGGAQAAIALRQRGFAGTIALVGDEPEPPYERPPLSKDYLSGEKSFERILIRPPAFWEERGVTLLLGRAVTQVDPAARRITLNGGDTLGYGELIWATGGSPRRLTCDGGALGGVHAVRTRADVDRLAAELAASPRVVIVGGGYIGLEAAAVLAKRGLSVTLLEAAPRLLARVAGETLSDFYLAEHRAHGVDVRLSTTADCILGTTQVTGVRLHDGSELPAGMVIVGIGIVPAVAPLLAAGADGGDGVEVDENCRTSLPHIYAVGDCARHASTFAGGRRVRIESVQNANDMATTAARAITGTPEPYRATPWFWSNQYDLKLQTVGLSTGHDAAVPRGDAAVTRGDPASRSFSIVYLLDGRVIALDCVNATRDYVQGRKLVETGSRIDPRLLAEASVPLKEMVAA